MSEAKHIQPRFRAVAFDLLTALIDSWSLWIDIANDESLGRSWRRSSLRRVTTAGSYQPYQGDGVEAAVGTNCSQPLAEAAAAATGHHFDAIVSAEKAKVYKTDPGAYRAGLAALGNPAPEDVLFVAGSAHDVPGAGAVGMPVYWSNRFGEAVPLGAPHPLRNEPDLSELPSLLMVGPKDR